MRFRSHGNSRHPAPQRSRRLRRRAFGAVVVLLVGSAVLLNRSRPPSPAPPMPKDLSAIDPFVARAIRDAVADLHENPDDAIAYGELGRIYHASEFFELARACYERAETLEPTASDWPYYLGQIAFHLGRADTAVRHYRRVLELAPRDAFAQLRLGDVLLALDQHEAAEAAYTRYNELAPRQAWGLLGLGKLARRRKEMSDAVRHLEQALAIEPRCKQTAYLLSMTYRALGRAQDADRQLQHYDSLSQTVTPYDPRMAKVAAAATSIEAQLTLANDLLDAGQLERAEAIYHQVLTRDPDEYSALTNLGSIYWVWKRYDEALAVLERATAVEPTYAHAHTILAHVHLDTDEPFVAKAEARLAIRYDPANDDAHYVLALCHEVLGQRQAAVAELNQVLRLNPERADATAWLERLRNDAERDGIAP